MCFLLFGGSELFRFDTPNSQFTQSLQSNRSQCSLDIEKRSIDKFTKWKIDFHIHGNECDTLNAETEAEATKTTAMKNRLFDEEKRMKRSDNGSGNGFLCE